MKMKLVSGAAALIGALAFLASPSVAAPHFSGGGGHFGGHISGAHSFAGGARFSGARGAWTGGGHWGGGSWRGHWGGGWWGPGWGWGWYDPFFWGGVGFVAGYELAPNWDYDYSDGYGYPPPAAAAAPPGYNCDGWRWDASQQRYVAAKVACQ